MKKTVISLLFACVCVVLCACSEEIENNDDLVSQEQWISAADGGTDEVGASEDMDVFIVEQAKTFDQVAAYEESQSVINLISQLSDDDFATAMVYDPSNREPFSDDQVILLFQGETSNTKIYGYVSAEYYSRGIILSFNGEYSCFDLSWSSDYGKMDVYEQDFDHDGVTEVGFCFLGSHGTGISIERLVIFDDIEGTGTFSAYEFMPEMQFEQNLLFTMDLEEKKLFVTKGGQTEKIIDWEKYEDQVVDDTFGIDCLNQISFEINGDEIKLCADIGILFNKVGGSTLFFEDDQGAVYFNIMYSNGVFQIQ